MACHTAMGALADLFWIIPGGSEISLITFIGNSAGANLKKTAINYAIMGTVVAVTIVLIEWLFFLFTKSWLAEVYFS